MAFKNEVILDDPNIVKYINAFLAIDKSVHLRPETGSEFDGSVVLESINSNNGDVKAWVHVTSDGYIELGQIASPGGLVVGPSTTVLSASNTSGTLTAMANTTNINGNSRINIDAPTVVVDASTEFDITSPLTDIHGQVNISSQLTVDGNAQFNGSTVSAVNSYFIRKNAGAVLYKGPEALPINQFGVIKGWTINLNQNMNLDSAAGSIQVPVRGWYFVEVYQKLQATGSHTGWGVGFQVLNGFGDNSNFQWFEVPAGRQAGRYSTIMPISPTNYYYATQNSAFPVTTVWTIIKIVLISAY